jgi:hypothetical protein
MLAGCVLVIVACRRPAPTTYRADAVVEYPKPVDEPNKSLPPDLFKDMPIFPGAKIEHVRKPTHSMREILFSTDAKLNPIAAYYKEQLKKNNFQISSTLMVPARQSWSCSFYISGRPGNILLYPSAEEKSRMTIALMYVLPDKPNDMYLEPKEEFDVMGPGEMVQAPSNSSDKSASK